jgi:alpha-beta hydrolase superfamily lysophospholipase
MASTEFELQGSQGKIVVRKATPESASRAVRDEPLDDVRVAAVYAPDHRGHGRSEGPRAVVDDVDAMADDLHLVVQTAKNENAGLPLVLIGHSMGGLMSIRYAQRYGSELTALVVSGPFLGNPMMAPLLEMEVLPDIPIDPAALSRDPAVGEAYAADPLVYHGPLIKESLVGMFGAVEQVAGGPTLALPVLWVHGEADQLAIYDSAKVLLEKVGGDNLTAKAYAGAAHEVFNETNQDEVVNDVAAFLAQVA